jgi:S-adenosylmethionine hydrolase
VATIITLTTDFGLGSPYLAAMKGVILSINPEARLVDISHAVGPQNVRQGAVVLAEATTWFPAGTIHVGVVDPGVGTARRIVYARIGDQQYIVPDNGLLSRLTLKTRPSLIVAVENPEHWLPSVSNTFHGRDIMAPVAAQLSLGMEPDRLGPPLAELVELDWPQPRIEANSIVGEVVWIDGFGNLITNITDGMLAAIQDRTRATVNLGEHTIRGIDRTYGDRSANTPLALIGSSGYLEVSVAGGSAAVELNTAAGTPILLRW